MRHENKAEIGCGDVLDQPAIKRGEDGFTDRGTLSQDVIAPNTQDRIALSAHEIIAAAIIGTAGVLGPVDFHDKPFFAAGEVRVVWSDRELSRELVAAKSAGF
ncbi:hypothetical protein ASD99_19100 [Mesorhizobium sp. Root695]|nr:hypothetical protein ASD99_19100 [Mesorhizobium sp. Root695]